jgi:hypothetical protein
MVRSGSSGFARVAAVIWNFRDERDKGKMGPSREKPLASGRGKVQ